MAPDVGGSQPVHRSPRLDSCFADVDPVHPERRSCQLQQAAGQGAHLDSWAPFPLLIFLCQSMGFGTFETILVGLPTCFFQVVFPLSASMVVRKWKNTRSWTMIAGCLPAFLGFILQYAAKGGTSSSLRLLPCTSSSVFAPMTELSS